MAGIPCLICNAARVCNALSNSSSIGVALVAMPLARDHCAPPAFFVYRVSSVVWSQLALICINSCASPDCTTRVRARCAEAIRLLPLLEAVFDRFWGRDVIQLICGAGTTISISSLME